MSWVWVVAAAAVAFVAWFAFGRRWLHALWYSWRRAAHAYAEVEADYGSGPTFYGSMLPEEDPHAQRMAGLRARYGDIYAGPHELTWWEQTRVELSPETLAADDPGLGDDLSSLASPGPDQNFRSRTEVVDPGLTPARERTAMVAGEIPARFQMGTETAVLSPTRLADTGEIRDAHLLAEVAAELRAQDDDARAYCSALERDRQTYMHQLREVFA